MSADRLRSPSSPADRFDDGCASRGAAIPISARVTSDSRPWCAGTDALADRAQGGGRHALEVAIPVRAPCLSPHGNMSGSQEEDSTRVRSANLLHRAMAQCAKLPLKIPGRFEPPQARRRRAGLRTRRRSTFKATNPFASGVLACPPAVPIAGVGSRTASLVAVTFEGELRVARTKIFVRRKTFFRGRFSALRETASPSLRKLRESPTGSRAGEGFAAISKVLWASMCDQRFEWPPMWSVAHQVPPRGGERDHASDPRPASRPPPHRQPGGRSVRAADGMATNAAVDIAPSAPVAVHRLGPSIASAAARRGSMK